MNEVFEVKNISMAAAFLVQGIEMADIHLSEDSGFAYFTFYFENAQEFDAKVSAYWSKAMPVDAYTFSQEMKYLRDEINEVLRRL